MIIEVNNLTSGRIDEKFLKKAVGLVLTREKKEKNLSLALVGQKRIKELNRKYRKKNKATDVLSFSYGETGEIILCPPVIRKNAKKYGLPFKEELSRITIHGLLHLLGYGHQKIIKKEEYYLSKI